MTIWRDWQWGKQEPVRHHYLSIPCRVNLLSTWSVIAISSIKKLCTGSHDRIDYNKAAYGLLFITRISNRASAGIIRNSSSHDVNSMEHMSKIKKKKKNICTSSHQPLTIIFSPAKNHTDIIKTFLVWIKVQNCYSSSLNAALQWKGTLVKAEIQWNIQICTFSLRLHVNYSYRSESLGRTIGKKRIQKTKTHQ